ncbi:hypothetical protein BpHYR1_046359 [Brachionus plicatilis]|uniref:Uncharacterized protein n=1 Tax=Brachionus plicatilis TaxID=10195 RepID=A0A3M7RG77_BRAPC|nr:hypothetical protein BpHYR1_046359 [Brachionus plicatilis]
MFIYYLPNFLELEKLCLFSYSACYIKIQILFWLKLNNMKQKIKFRHKLTNLVTKLTKQIAIFSGSTLKVHSRYNE